MAQCQPTCLGDMLGFRQTGGYLMSSHSMVTLVWRISIKPVPEKFLRLTCLLVSSLQVLMAMIQINHMGVSINRNNQNWMVQNGNIICKWIIQGYPHFQETFIFRQTTRGHLAAKCHEEHQGHIALLAELQEGHTGIFVGLVPRVITEIHWLLVQKLINTS